MTVFIVVLWVGWAIVGLVWLVRRLAARPKPERPEPKPVKKRRPEPTRHVEPAGRGAARRQRKDTERFAGGVSATSKHAQALGLFDGASGLPQRGPVWGPYLSTAGDHCYDPFELYPDEIQDPGMVVWGRKGQRKSTAIKVYLRRQHRCGKHIWVIDPWGEYKALCDDLGGTFIDVKPNGGVCLNPLANSEDRHELLKAVARASLPRPLKPREPAGLETALDELIELHPNQEPTLPGVLALLHEPTPAMCKRRHATKTQLKEELRDVAEAMDPLTGALGGMFDGPTSEDLDLENRFIVVSLRSLMGSASLGVMLACAVSFMQAKIGRLHAEAEARNEKTPKAILAIDEAWHIFAVPGIAEWLQLSVKQDRKLGKQIILVFHRLGDLDAAGDDGSRTMKLVRGLMEDMSTFVYFRCEASELDRMAETMHLTSSEKDVLKDLRPGESLHKIAGAPFVVATRVHPNELPLVKIDHAMEV